MALRAQGAAAVHVCQWAVGFPRLPPLTVDGCERDAFSEPIVTGSVTSGCLSHAGLPLSPFLQAQCGSPAASCLLQDKVVHGPGMPGLLLTTAFLLLFQV